MELNVQDNSDAQHSYGLDNLFTVQEYQPVTICIPRGSPILNSDEQNTGQDCHLSIEILQSPAACTDPDLTGQVLWPVSRLLSYFIAAKSPSIVHGKTVIELGAGGTALPSLTSAYCGAKTVVATDGNDGAVLSLLQENIQRHQMAIAANLTTNATSVTQSVNNASSLTSRQLLWGSRRQLRELLQPSPSEQCDSLAVDVVVAADVVQWPAVVEPLLHTVKALLWRDEIHRPKNNNRQQTDDNISRNEVTVHYPKPIFLLGLVPRAASVCELFFALARDMGFVTRQIDPCEYLSNGVIPPCCQEQGGRLTEIYELYVRPGCDPPILLSNSTNLPGIASDDHSADRLVGTSFEHTTFLPC